MKATTQRGVILIENMVALLIFSVGILGMIGMVATSLKNTADAKFRNNASFLANQIVARMWVDDKTNATLKSNYESPNGARYVEWKTAVAGVLPDVAANPPIISVNAQNVVTVSVRWKLPGAQAASNYTMSAMINQ
jgi:type IV pilus assembly protein PilV